MSSETPKKPSMPKRIRPVLPTRLEQHNRNTKRSVTGNNIVVKQELPTVKITNEDVEILEITSSDDAQESAKLIHSVTPMNVRRHVPQNSTSVEKTMRTRSANGITRKRILEDAAVFSGDDNLLKGSPTKKPRRIISKVIMDKSDDDHEDISDAKQPQTDLESFSISPLKLHRSHVDDDDDGCDSFIDDDISEYEKKSRRKGKNKADYISDGQSEMGNLNEEEGHLHPDEVVAIAKAVEQSRQVFPMHQDAWMAGTGSPSHINDMNIKADHVDFGNSIPVGASTISNVSPRRTFRDLFPVPQTTPMMSAGPTLYDDALKFRVQSLPDTCEVNQSNLRDELLMDSYDGLPSLRFGSLRPWSNVADSAMTLVSFSQWPVQCPDMYFDSARDAVTFVKYKNFIGPSRISPLDVNIFYTSLDRKRSILQCNYQTAICITPILSQECFLITASATGLRNKYISGHFHQLEWQRFEAFTCMVFNKPSMIAQINNRAISFGTLGPTKSDREMLSSPSKYSAQHGSIPRNPAILTESSSSHKPGTTSGFRSVLSYTDDIPIYDAREHPFNFASDLQNLSSVLPRYRDEIPPYSFVVVGYTLSHYEKEGRSHLATNIQFAILFGCE